ncbi:hypothetical protein [Limosilactobacillus secaliphilus]|uniref:Uncharacterized protein n=1 Tax=Limosilactobacillus secaliphilus TaxID=396268 RepID=A0A0R2IAL3_9LACO|nr:hypothetical protein [Limosilactobacillus secaliphilus]KRN59191.1 hypothetical protein IV45_GL000230 [Limosilactobacillus secaliphilus]
MNTAEIRAQLVMAQQQGRMLEVYNFNDDNDFNVGYVIAIDPLFVLMKSIDWDGKVSSLIAIRLTSIHKVRAFTDYLKTVAIKGAVARKNHYYDLWGTERFLKQHHYENKSLLKTMLTQAQSMDEAVVVGTRKYKAQDEFEGFVHQLTAQKLTLHYYNEHDLSSEWEYDILLAQIDYLRAFGTQSATTKAVMRSVFDD